MASTAPKRNVDPDFPCTLIIKTPFPTHRLASTALQALQVDAELSPLVQRRFSLVQPPKSPVSTSSTGSADGSEEPRQDEPSNTTAPTEAADSVPAAKAIPKPAPPVPAESTIITTSTGQTVLLTEYRAKTNRMLRVAVNGFMESLGVVLGVMERLDVDVLAAGKRTGSAGTSGAPVASHAAVAAGSN